MGLRLAFGGISPPGKITQEAYDSGPHHLHRLARLRTGDRAEVSDLWQYMQDLLYAEIQGALFAYLLPFCLEAWRDDLSGIAGYGGFVEYFYPVLANKQIFDRYLTPAQGATVSDFMRDSILEEIDAQRDLKYKGKNARPYRWVAALTTHGVLLPDLDRLWTAWWSVDTVGRAVAAVQYISCLMYPENENPVFDPWTPDGGGGPPCLWEFGGHLNTQRWLDANVRVLRRNLNVQGASAVLDRSVKRLVDRPEHEAAAEIEADLPLCAEVLAARCSQLPCLLETNQEAGNLPEWSK